MAYVDPVTGAVTDAPSQAWINKYGVSTNQQGQVNPWGQSSVDAVVNNAGGGSPLSAVAPAAAVDPAAADPSAGGGSRVPFADQIGKVLSSITGGASTNWQALLPVLLSSGLGLWQKLGTQAAFDKAGNLINNAETTAGNDVNNSEQQLGRFVMDTGNGAASDVTAAGKAAGTGAIAAAGAGNNILGDLYKSSLDRTAPYSTTGTTAATQLNTALQPGGALNTPQTMDSLLANDPGYQARLKTGEQGIQRQLSAAGLGESGAAVKELERYAQDYASNETGAAFNRDQTSKQNLFADLYNGAGLGTTANSQDLAAATSLGAPQSTNLINASQYAGNSNLTATDEAGRFNTTAAPIAADLQSLGSQYKANAGVTGASAQAGATMGANQAQNQFISQLMDSILSLFKQNNTTVVNNGAANPTPNAPPNPFAFAGA